MKAYDYQTKGVENIQTGKTNLMVFPMGAGKSYLMWLIQDKYRFKKVLIVVGFRKIVIQLKSYFEDSTYILSSKPFNNDATVHIGTFQTLAKRNIDLSQYDCIMTDEYHSRLSKSAKNVIFQPNTTICLFTGTPLDNKNRRLTDGVDNWVQPVTIAELIANGQLAPTRFMVNSSMLTDYARELEGKKQDFDESIVRRIIQKEDLLANIKEIIIKNKLHTDHKTVIYVNYIETAKMMYELLKEFDNVFLIHSKVPQKEQDKRLELYENCTNGVVISVRSLSLGWDSPSTDRVIYGIFTKIHSLVLQALWRGSRIDPNNPNKETIVYDMTGQLGVKNAVNPYTNFNEYSKFKKTCQDQCKEFSENSIARDMCLEGCKTPEEMFVVCDGKPSYSYEQNSYASNFQVRGKPCKVGRPFWEYEFKTTRPKGSIGLLHKWCKCPCGCITRYTLETITQPSKVIEVYSDVIPQNKVTVLYSKEHKKALLWIDDIKDKKMYTYKYVSTPEEAYVESLQYFKGRKFSMLSNVSMKKITNSASDHRLNKLLEYIDWEDINNQQIVKNLIKSRVIGMTYRLYWKKGFVFKFIKGIDRFNEKETYEKVKKDLGKQALLTLYKKINGE